MSEMRPSEGWREVARTATAEDRAWLKRTCLTLLLLTDNSRPEFRAWLEEILEMVR